MKNYKAIYIWQCCKWITHFNFPNNSSLFVISNMWNLKLTHFQNENWEVLWSGSRLRFKLLQLHGPLSCSRSLASMWMKVAKSCSEFPSQILLPLYQDILSMMHFNSNLYRSGKKMSKPEVHKVKITCHSWQYEEKINRTICLLAILPIVPDIIARYNDNKLNGIKVAKEDQRSIGLMVNRLDGQ